MNPFSAGLKSSSPLLKQRAPTKLDVERYGSGVRGHWTLVDDHPRGAEPVPEHAEAEGKKGLLHGHEDLTALREQAMNPFRPFDAADGERKVDTAHRLKSCRRNIAAHDLCPVKDHVGVEDAFRGRGVLGAWLLAVLHHRDDLAAQMLFVEAEGLLAVAAIVEIRVHFHRVVSSDDPRSVSGLTTYVDINII
jgi:hypothetical protein